MTDGVFVKLQYSVGEMFNRVTEKEGNQFCQNAV